ncbi:MAG TPA: tetratricopeptide repeat protein [Steroidobacteraceae bacterium]
MRILEPTSGAAAALVICLGTLSCRAVLAQVAYDPQLVLKKAQVCADPAQPPADRVRSCTGVMDRSGLAKSALVAALDERGDALRALGKTDEAIADFSQAISLAPRDVVAYSGRAKLYLASERLDLGIVDLTQVLRIEPANGTALYNRGVAYQRSGKDDKALDDFRAAVALSPPFAPAQLALDTLAKADLPRAASAAPGAVTGNFAAVKKNADICADPTQPPAARMTNCTLVLKEAALHGQELAHVLDNRANALMALSKRDDALADLNEAIAANPRDEIGLASRATLYMDVHRADLAEQDLDKLKLINPNNGTAFYNAGVTEQASGDLDKAVDDYRTAVRLLPSFAPAHAALGALLKVKDPNSALAELNRALELDAQSTALDSRASLYLSRGQFEPAIHDFDELLARDSANSLAYLNRGVAKEQAGNLQGALEDYARSIEVAPSASAHFDRANLYVQLDQPDQALADFNAALEIDPNNIKALLGRADMNYGARRLTDSLTDYTRVVAAQPKNAEVFFKRGSVYFDMGNFAAAYRDYSVSLALNPQQPDVLRNRALAAERMGTSKDARNDRQRARASEP